jgi:peroxiredoxin
MSWNGFRFIVLGLAIAATGCNRGAEPKVAKSDEKAKPTVTVTPATPPTKTEAAKPEAAKSEAAKPDAGNPDPGKSTTPASVEKPKDPKPADVKPADPKPADVKPAADKPSADKPSADKPNAGTPGVGDKPNAAPSETPAKPAAPIVVRKDLDVEGQIRLILDMVNQPRAVRKTAGFIDQFLATTELLLQSDASPAYKSSALLAKFKVLHEAAVDGYAPAQDLLVKLAEAERKNTGKRVAAYVRLVDMEQKLMSLKGTDAAAIKKQLDELKEYLAAEELSNRHLRLAMLTTDLIERLPEDERDARYKALGQEYAKSVDLDLAYVGERFGKPAVKPSALLGKPFDLSGKLISGEDLKWPNYRGKITVVDFWATWCPLCNDQIPRLKEINNQYHGRGLEVVGVSIDTDKTELEKFLRENSIPWITLFGKEPQTIASKYGVRGVPSMFLIDAEGKILLKANNIAELEPQIKTEIEALEKKAKAAKK